MYTLCTRKLTTLNQLLPSASLYAPQVRGLIDRWQTMDAATSLPDMDALFRLMHETQRMEWIMAFGLQFQPYFVDAQLALAGAAWDEPEAFELPSRTQAERLAQRLMDGVGLKAADKLQINGSYYSKPMLYMLAEHCLKQDIDFEMDFPDAFLRQSFALQATDSMMKHYADWFEQRGLWATKLLAVRSNTHDTNPGYLDPQEQQQAKDKLGAVLKDAIEKLDKRRRNALADDYTPWSLTYLPTPKEAELDGIDYADYKKLFFEACDQPWEEIGTAQEKLIEAFNAGKQVRITNSDGTDISFSIEGHQFANSVVVRNIPGSEFFSAPVKHSVNGTIVAKGTFYEKQEGLLVKDMVLQIKNGRIESWDAAEGKDDLGKVITKGDSLPVDDKAFEGNRYFGEIGFGTNPHLSRHMCNGLLVEKISGSFHLAIGGAYDDGYLGKEVKLDNGNKGVRGFHWDVTTMLKGKDGEIWLDGHLMQKDGVWQAVPALGISDADVEVLNKGWAALPEPKRPGWFKAQAAQQVTSAAI